MIMKAILKGLLVFILLFFTQLSINAQRKDGAVVVTTPRGTTQPLSGGVKESESYKYIITESVADFDVVFYIEKHSKTEDVLRFEWQRAKAKGKNYIFELILKQEKNNSLSLSVVNYGGVFGYTIAPKEGNWFKCKHFADETNLSKKEKVPLLLFYEERLYESFKESEINKLYEGLLEPEKETYILSDILDITNTFFMITYDVLF